MSQSMNHDLSKRYWVFCGFNNYPEGGIDDLLTTFDKEPSHVDIYDVIIQRRQQEWEKYLDFIDPFDCDVPEWVQIVDIMAGVVEDKDYKRSLRKILSREKRTNTDEKIKELDKYIEENTHD
jgi:hypothetical protein